MQGHSNEMNKVLNFIQAMLNLVPLDGVMFSSKENVIGRTEPAHWFAVVETMATLEIGGARNALSEESGGILKEIERQVGKHFEDNRVPAVVLVGKWEASILAWHWRSRITVGGDGKHPTAANIHGVRFYAPGAELELRTTDVRSQLVVETREWLEHQLRKTGR
jgi:hypothetical protein